MSIVIHRVTYVSIEPYKCFPQGGAAPGGSDLLTGEGVIKGYDNS
jgi:hypothetical protein